MSETAEPITEQAERTYPPGEYAIVEIMGHTTLVGRIAEVERFGTKMLAIEPLFNGEFLTPIYQGGQSIYRLTPCSGEIAFKEQPTREWQLPPALQKIVPPALLPPPAADRTHSAEPDDDDDEITERDLPF